VCTGIRLHGHSGALGANTPGTPWLPFRDRPGHLPEPAYEALFAHEVFLRGVGVGAGCGDHQQQECRAKGGRHIPRHGVGRGGLEARNTHAQKRGRDWCGTHLALQTAYASPRFLGRAYFRES